MCAAFAWLVCMLAGDCSLAQGTTMADFVAWYDRHDSGGRVLWCDVVRCLSCVATTVMAPAAAAPAAERPLGNQAAASIP